MELKAVSLGMVSVFVVLFSKCGTYLGAMEDALHWCLRAQFSPMKILWPRGGLKVPSLT